MERSGVNRSPFDSSRANQNLSFAPHLLRGNSYLRVVQKVPKCDVTLLSIYNSDWSQKGKFNSCNIITLDV